MLSVASLYIENDHFHVSFLRLRVSNRDLIKNVFTLILTFGTHVFPGFRKVLRRRDFIPPRPDPSRTSLSLRLACVPQHLLVTRDHVPRPSLLPSSRFCTTCQHPLLPVSNLFIHPPLSSEWFSAYFYNYEKHHSSKYQRLEDPKCKTFSITLLKNYVCCDLLLMLVFQSISQDICRPLDNSCQYKFNISWVST